MTSKADIVPRESDRTKGTDSIETRKAEEETPKEAGEAWYTRAGISGLKLTAIAMEKLKQSLESRAVDSSMSYRISTSSLNPNQLKMSLDRERPGDHFLEKDGRKLLLADSIVLPMLKELVIDYHEKPQGGNFVITKSTEKTHQ